MGNMTTENLQDLRSTREARARRLKSIRKMTRLSRREFAERYSIPQGTLQNWEDARYGGLTEKGAKRALMAFKTEGIHCTLEWLMHGIGLGPQITEHLYLSGLHDANGEQIVTTETTESGASDSFATVIQELLLFRQLNANAIDSVISDDSMEPRFVAGEHVAGIQRFGDHIKKLVGFDCIVQTTDGAKLVRSLRAGSQDGTYTLVSINQQTTVEKPILYDIEVHSAAPIIWARRKDPAASE